MGYRSDVASIIYGDGSQEDNDMVNALWVRAKMEGLISKINDDDTYSLVKLITVEQANASLTCIYLKDDSIKWYEESSWVKAWRELLRLAATQEYNLNTEFVRLGEDITDTECESDGDTVQSLLYVARSIGEDFVISEDKETENG